MQFYSFCHYATINVNPLGRGEEWGKERAFDSSHLILGLNILTSYQEAPGHMQEQKTKLNKKRDLVLFYSDFAWQEQYRFFFWCKIFYSLAWDWSTWSLHDWQTSNRSNRLSSLPMESGRQYIGQPFETGTCWTSIRVRHFAKQGRQNPGSHFHVRDNNRTFL